MVCRGTLHDLCKLPTIDVLAGISHNKLLAKLASAMNKPNKQTVIPHRAVDTLMAALPVKKIRNFGGKVGQALEELGCVTAGDVQRLPQAALAGKFGERAGCAATLA
jgi:DNA polymerase eta